MNNRIEHGGNVVKRTARLLLQDTADVAWTMVQPGGFQSQVNVQPSPAVAGDFATSNPRALYVAGPGGLVSGANGLTVGAFAWVAAPLDQDNAPQIASNTPTVFGGLTAGTAAPTPNVAGFVHREQQGLITTFLRDASQVIPQGFPVTLMTQGDFWTLNSGTGQALIGQKAYASIANGLVSFALSGSPPGNTGFTTGTVISTNAGFIGSISGNILTVTGAPTNLLYPGGALSSGTVTGIAPGTVIESQTSGVTGSIGTYQLNIGEQTVASGSMSEVYSIMSVPTPNSSLAVGDLLLSGTAGLSGALITALATGTSGLYVLNTNVTAGAVGVTAQIAVETKWYAVSSGAAGELVKISSWSGTQG